MKKYCIKNTDHIIDFGDKIEFGLVDDGIFINIKGRMTKENVDTLLKYDVITECDVEEEDSDTTATTSCDVDERYYAMRESNRVLLKKIEKLSARVIKLEELLAELNETVAELKAKSDGRENKKCSV